MRDRVRLIAPLDCRIEQRSRIRQVVHAVAELDQADVVLGIIEQDVKALDSGRILTAFHVQPGLQVKPYYTDDPLGVNIRSPSLEQTGDDKRGKKASGMLSIDGVWM